MFERNDSALHTARRVTKIIIWTGAAASLVSGIVLAIVVHEALFLITFAGWLACWLVWVYVRLLFSYLYDIKLIRNKLYSESKSPSQVEKAGQPKPELVKLQQRLEAGEISKEEYEKMKILYT